MKNNIIIGLMTLVWLVLMANIIWRGTDGKWCMEDAEKIGQLEVAKYTNQIVVVAVSDEEARLCLYEKGKRGEDEPKEEWKLVLETDAIIGKNGLGKRKEGDGKTPVGVFRFTKAFGILENPGTKMEYIQVDENYYWVDDSNSNYYNQFIAVDEINPDWESAEHISEYEESYHYVLATSYNSECVSGVGSAVFLHCTSGTTSVTAGCVAVPETYMKEILKRVKPECVLIIDEEEHILEY